MKPNDLNTALYEKMAAEQDKFRDWLKSQPSEYHRPCDLGQSADHAVREEYGIDFVSAWFF